MTILPFRAFYPLHSMISSPDSFFGDVKHNYPEYRENGFFHRTSQEGFYAYKIEGEEREYTGLIGCVSLRDYGDGRILKHENTLAEKEQKHINLILQRKAMIKPVLLTMPGIQPMQGLLDETIQQEDEVYSFTFKDVDQTHRFWSIADGTKISYIKSLFREEVDQVYIADGHHRLETSWKLNQSKAKRNRPLDIDYLISAFFPFDQLEIWDYNRVLEIFQDLSSTRFLALLSRVCNIEAIKGGAKPSKKFEMTLFIDREWYRLSWKPAVLQKYKEETICLDAHIFNEEILKELIGIEDVRTDDRIKYVSGVKGIEGLRQKTLKKHKRAGLMLYPVQMEELTALADMNRVLPPKSTWFEPRLKNGLIVQEFK